MLIDVDFDFRTDSKVGDPDSASLQLKKYHQILWSKQLPNGYQLELMDSEPKSYLTANVRGNQFNFVSDSIANSYAKSNASEIKAIVSKIDPLIVDEFVAINSTIGGYIIFPGNKVDGKMTINGARGFNRLIADRFDLTLECIRRFYQSERSPLTEVLNRYLSFFELFGDFAGYVNFFLLEDLLSPSGFVKYFTQIKEPFSSSGYPKTVEEYLEYRKNSIQFVLSRNQRIKELN